MKTTGRCGYLAMMLVLAAMVAGHGAVLDVPTQYPSIQAAHDASSPGDVIRILPGTYSNQHTIVTRGGIEIRGEPAGQAVLIGDSTNPVIQFRDFTARSAVAGLTLRRGSIGIDTSNAFLTVSACAIQSCGAGIVAHHSRITIASNTIQNCRRAYGGGIVLSATSTAVVCDNYISDCWDGGLNSVDSSALIVRNRLISNQSWDLSGGMNFVRSKAVIAQNTVAYSRISNGSGGAGMSASESRLGLYNNTFVGNTFAKNYTTWGSALYAWATDIEACNNIFSHNGGGSTNCLATIYLAGPGASRFTFNSFASNSCAAAMVGVTYASNNLSAYPAFTNPTTFALGPGSPCRDAGCPDRGFRDADGTRADLGVEGGVFPPDTWLTSMSASDGIVFTFLRLADPEVLTYGVERSANGASWTAQPVTSSDVPVPAGGLGLLYETTVHVPADLVVASWFRVITE